MSEVPQRAVRKQRRGGGGGAQPYNQPIPPSKVPSPPPKQSSCMKILDSLPMMRCGWCIETGPEVVWCAVPLFSLNPTSLQQTVMLGYEIPATKRRASCIGLDGGIVLGVGGWLCSVPELGKLKPFGHVCCHACTVTKSTRPQGNERKAKRLGQKSVWACRIGIET
ncbi:hypothetical protein BD289DRAFT_35174 [Coniella lustricola]|uniref:Uncharacterized protein n=1 Tax=Coniella lustricola TaxID=2025994 RepID=A0A2T3A284_9PEZI|nr:hypothetical protein BD289DRAFT_35174 [Coniella lustricola]